MSRYNLSFILVLIFLVSIPFVFSETIPGIFFNSVWFGCGIDDDVCPSELDPQNRPCLPPDDDCDDDIIYGYIDGTAFCDDRMCGDTENENPTPGQFTDDYCPTDHDPHGRFCYSIDDDCKQCVIYKTNISSDDPVINASQVYLNSTVHGDDCKEPGSLTLRMVNPEGQRNCSFKVNWQDLEHNFTNYEESAAGHIYGNGTEIREIYIPPPCSEKEVCVYEYYENQSMNFTNREPLNSNSEGCFEIGEIEHGNCYVVIQGYITDLNYETPIEEVYVRLKTHNGSIEVNVITDINPTYPDGWYYIYIDERMFDTPDLFIDTEGEDYELLFHKTGYSPHLNETFTFQCNTVIEYNATMYQQPSLCQMDCTKIGSRICNSQCHGWNGCLYNNLEIRNICDPVPDNAYGGSVLGHQRTWQDQTIRCCRGDQAIGTIIADDILVPEDSRNVVKTTRIVFIEGQPVRLNVLVYD